MPDRCLQCGENKAYAFDKKVVSITLPDDHYVYRPGPNQEEANSFCSACHAADYVYMQPPLSQKQWEGEVTKMVNVFKCPVAEDKVAPIVEYLVSQSPPAK
jgi:hypothetical protein